MEHDQGPFDETILEVLHLESSSNVSYDSECAQRLGFMRPRDVPVPCEVSLPERSRQSRAGALRHVLVAASGAPGGPLWGTEIASH